MDAEPIVVRRHEGHNYLLMPQWPIRAMFSPAIFDAPLYQDQCAYDRQSGIIWVSFANARAVYRVIGGMPNHYALEADLLESDIEGDAPTGDWWEQEAADGRH